MRFLLLLVLVCWPSIAAAQDEKGESTVSGRVVHADTGKPVRRVTVSLFSNLSVPPDRTTSSNARGDFRFNEVAAGTYFVLAEIPGGISPVKAFVITEFGYTNDIDVEHTRVTVDGKNAVRCEVRVARAGSIRGTITYSDKEPVTGAPILLFRRKNGVTAPYFVRRVETNDRGMYRIDGLPDGEYIVGVKDSMQRVVFRTQEDAGSVVTSYYPGVGNITEAKTVQIQAGSEAGAINMTLADDRVHQISGVIKWRDSGLPVPLARLRLRKLDEPKVEASFEQYLSAVSVTGVNEYNWTNDALDFSMLTFPPGTDADLEGKWKFPELPPGKYLLTATTPSEHLNARLVNVDGAMKIEGLMDPDGWGPVTMRQFELTLGDTDLNDVVLEMTMGARISGTVIGEESPLPNLWLYLKRDGKQVDNRRFFRERDKGAFVLERVPPGELRLEAQVLNDSDSYVKSITLGSQDLMRSPLRVEEGAEIDGVRITLGRGVAKLSGRVSFSDGGAPAPGSGVLLVKADPSLWHSPTARALAIVDAAGDFAIECPPGDYVVFTWAAGNQPVQSMDEFIRTQATSARRISLQKDEEKQIELTVAKPKQ